MQVIHQTDTVKAVMEKLPDGFLLTTTNKAGRTALKPMSRVDFRKKNRLTNAAAKRDYANHLATFARAVRADFNYQLDTGFLPKAVEISKSGVRCYKVAEVDGAVAPLEVTRESALKALGLSEDDMKALAGLSGNESEGEE